MDAPATGSAAGRRVEPARIVRLRALAALSPGQRIERLSALTRQLHELRDAGRESTGRP